MARIPDAELARIKAEVSVQRLVEGCGGVYAMNYFETIDSWLITNDQLLADANVNVHSARSSDDLEKRSAHLALSRGDAFGEVIVWSTGEAEFAVGEVGGESTDQHFDLDGPEQLVPLLDAIRVAVLDGL